MEKDWLTSAWWTIYWCSIGDASFCDTNCGMNIHIHGKQIVWPSYNNKLIWATVDQYAYVTPCAVAGMSVRNILLYLDIRHDFTDDVFQCIVVNKNDCFFLLRIIVHSTTWQQAGGHFLNKKWLTEFTDHICARRPQLVKAFVCRIIKQL